jgi:hypothetical protein
VQDFIHEESELNHPCYVCALQGLVSIAIHLKETNNVGGFISLDACVTKPGYYFAGSVGIKCPRGTWNPEGNRNGQCTGELRRLLTTTDFWCNSLSCTN